jgi:hypothetical protein
MAEKRGRGDLDAGRVRRDEDLRRSLVRRSIGIGNCHDDAERRALGAAREPFVPVDDPVVAVAHSARL